MLKTSSDAINPIVRLMVVKDRLVAPAPKITNIRVSTACVHITV